MSSPMGFSREGHGLKGQGPETLLHHPRDVPIRVEVETATPFTFCKEA